MVPSVSNPQCEQGERPAIGCTIAQQRQNRTLSELQLSFAAISGIWSLVTMRVVSVKLLGRFFVVVLALLAALAVPAAPQSGPADKAALPDPGPIYGARLEGFDY